MTYDEFMESQEEMLRYAQKAINIYDEIYNNIPDKFKNVQFGKSIPSVKSMFGRGKPYVVDGDEANFDSYGIDFTEVNNYYGDTERNVITVLSDWITPDETRQRELIESYINFQCKKIEDIVNERERKEEEHKKLQAEAKEKRDKEEYLRLKNKFES